VRLSAFHEVERAIEAGYADPRGGHCDASAAGAMGIHSPNPTLIQSQTLDPARPEVLLDLPNEGGGVRLISSNTCSRCCCAIQIRALSRPGWRSRPGPQTTSS
jgi:hypothetical protein